MRIPEGCMHNTYRAQKSWYICWTLAQIYIKVSLWLNHFDFSNLKCTHSPSTSEKWTWESRDSHLTDIKTPITHQINLKGHYMSSLQLANLQEWENYISTLNPISLWEHWTNQTNIIKSNTSITFCFLASKLKSFP